MNDDELHNALGARAHRTPNARSADDVFAAAQSELNANAGSNSEADSAGSTSDTDGATVTPLAAPSAASESRSGRTARVLAIAAVFLLVAGGAFIVSRDTDSIPGELAVGDDNEADDGPPIDDPFENPFPECGALWQSGDDILDPVADQARLDSLRDRVFDDIMSEPSNGVTSMGAENVYGRVSVGMSRSPETIDMIQAIVDEPEFGDPNLICVELPPVDYDDGPVQAVWTIDPGSLPVSDNWQNLTLLVDDPSRDCGHDPAGRVQEPTITYTDTEIIIGILLDGIPFGGADCQGWGPVEVEISLTEDPRGRPLVSPDTTSAPTSEPIDVEPGTPPTGDSSEPGSEVEFELLVAREDSADFCQPELVAVTRTGTEDSLAERLSTLLEGVGDDEGVSSPFGPETSGQLSSVEVVDGLARVDFVNLTASPTTFNSTSCGGAYFFNVLDANVLDYPGVDNVIYSDGGSQVRFYSFFQADPPEDPATWSVPEWIGTVVDPRDRSTGSGLRHTLRGIAEGAGELFIVSEGPNSEIIVSADATLDADDPVATGPLSEVGVLAGLTPPPDSGLTADPTIDEWLAYVGSSDAVRQAEVAVIDRAENSIFSDDPVYAAIYQRWPEAVTNTWIGPRSESGDAEAFIEVFTVFTDGVDVHALLFDPLGDDHVMPAAE